MVRQLFTLATAILLTLSAGADPLKGARRVLFLGDSITASGHYITLLEGALHPKHSTTEFINLGLSSEGCTGLSEPAHPFPRPDLHSRLDRALEKANPDVVFACYGMNDGIYHPFDQQRFAKFQAGINSLIRKVDQHGATLILMTPPPFDPTPLKNQGKLLPDGSKEYSWMKIFEHYDRDVLTRYAEWLLTRKEHVHLVIDLHTTMNTALVTERKTAPSFTFSPDGIHPNKRGHEIIAETIHQALYRKALPTLPPGEVSLVSQRQKIMHAAWLSHVGHTRPGVRAGLPLEEARRKAAGIR